MGPLSSRSAAPPASPALHFGQRVWLIVSIALFMWHVSVLGTSNSEARIPIWAAYLVVNAPASVLAFVGYWVIGALISSMSLPEGVEVRLVWDLLVLLLNAGAGWLQWYRLLPWWFGTPPEASS